MKRKAIAITVVILALAASAVTVTMFESNVTSLISGQFMHPVEHYTIIVSDSGPNMGINGSAYVQTNETSEPWPVLRVQLEDRVMITVINSNSSYEPHALGVSYYYPQGSAILQPGQSTTISFIANISGNFNVYDTLFSAIQQYTENGQLIVSK